MANLNVTFAGPPEQRIKVSITPMAKVLTVLEQACPKLKPALDPAACQLVLHEGRTKRVVDLQTPFRLANIPTTAKLEIIKVSGAAAPKDASRPSTAAHQAPAPQAAAASTSQQPTDSCQAAPTMTEPQPGPLAPSDPGATPPPSLGSEPPAAPPPWWKELGLDREVVLFTKAALDAAQLAAAAATGGTQPMDVSDDFYDLTPEDLAAISRAEKARKEEAAQLKTSALRAAAERAKAQSYGPVPVRVHLPDNVILQAAFSALEPLTQLQGLLCSVLAPQLAKSGAFSLYTTPPKQVLRDLSLSFFKAQLVPAAHVHVQLAGGAEVAGPILRSEVLALLQHQLDLETALPGQAAFVTPQQLQEAAQQQQQQAAAAAAAAGNGAASLGAGGSGSRAGAGEAPSTGQEAAAAPEEAPRVTAAGSKLPKWLKLK